MACPEQSGVLGRFSYWTDRKRFWSASRASGYPNPIDHAERAPRAFSREYGHVCAWSAGTPDHQKNAHRAPRRSRRGARAISGLVKPAGLAVWLGGCLRCASLCSQTHHRTATGAMVPGGEPRTGRRRPPLPVFCVSIMITEFSTRPHSGAEWG